MGCGFSSEDRKASDEERILKSTTASGNRIGTAKGSKKANKTEKPSTTELTSSAAVTNGKQGSKVSSSNTSAPLNIQSSTSEVSSSQVNFFKMLDEKIENGVELEEQDTDLDRQMRLQKVAEEWDNLLGRSQDSNELHLHVNDEDSKNEEAEAIVVELVANNTAVVESSNDSMRTMFSNSVGLPAGTLRETSDPEAAAKESSAAAAD